MFKKTNIKNKLAEFKKCLRKVCAECIVEDQEWILATSYSRANRLAAAGVTNKHAGVKGLPKMSKEEGR